MMLFIIHSDADTAKRVKSVLIQKRLKVMLKIETLKIALKPLGLNPGQFQFNFLMNNPEQVANSFLQAYYQAFVANRAGIASFYVIDFMS